MNNADDHALTISPVEKRKLREHKIKVGGIHHHPVAELQRLLGVSKIRAMELSALSEFQSLPSVGIRFATDLITMGYYSLKELKGKEGARLLDRYEKQIGVWADPCVEDQFRLIVHFADHPGVHKNWWDFTAERKAFRLKHGYPGSRPKKPWFELDRYQRFSNVAAARHDTKKDVAHRLNEAVRHMKKHYREKISLADLARVAAVSTYHFARQFKNVYEVTPMHYLTALRLKNATRLLKTKRLSVGQIGHQCGFENESAFIRSFKSQLKNTPLQFRKEWRKETISAS